MHISKYMCRVLCNEPQDVASWPARRSKAPGAPQVLSDPELLRQWQGECKEMADHIMKMRAAIKEDHIMAMRAALKEALYKSGSRKDWSHITEQIGMFCYSGLTPEQVERMKVEHHVYITRDGRISMAGLTSCNVRYVAEAIHSVIEE